MTSTDNHPEVDLLRPLAQRWREMGFCVHQEVRIHGTRIDLVASNEELLIAAQGKMQLDDKVIEQARLTQGIADLSIVVVPEPATLTDVHVARMKMLEAHGLGLTYSNGDGRVVQKIEPAPNHDAQPDQVRAVLSNGQKHYAPGGSKTEQWTPTKEWIEAIRRELEVCGEMRLIDAFGFQSRNRQRVAKGAVPRVVQQLIETGQMPFANIETRRGQSVLILMHTQPQESQ